MRILRRLGFSEGWGLLFCVPIVGLVGFWIIAFVSWPIEDDPLHIHEIGSNKRIALGDVFD